MFEDAETGKLGMLPTDIALIEDPDFKKWVEVYAADEARFFKDFSAAFGKLMANGTSCPDPVAAQPKKPEGKDKVSEKFRAMCMHGSEREVCTVDAAVLTSRISTIVSTFLAFTS